MVLKETYRSASRKMVYYPKQTSKISITKIGRQVHSWILREVASKYIKQCCCIFFSPLKQNEKNYMQGAS